MAEKLIISISGMRGIIGENLNAAIAVDYGCAFGIFLKSQCKNTGKAPNTPADGNCGSVPGISLKSRSKNTGKRPVVAIGTDTRSSGRMLSSAVSAGLCSVGVDVIDLSVVATPTVGIVLRHLGCDGGLVITASHNPIEYNGIKLLLSDGIAPGPEEAERIKQIYYDKDFSQVSSTDCGRITTYDDPDSVHLPKVLGCVDAAAIAACGFRVVLDSVNGAGARCGAALLSSLGCEVIPINDAPTGLFAHTPEPTAEHLTELCDKVKSSGADIGFAQDPDADRLAIVDEKGNYIGEEYTLALAARYIFMHRKGTAAANLSTSRMIDDIAAGYGCKVLRTAVGEANVAAAMVENSCIIGGEGNGGVIDLRVGPVRDSLVAMALVLQLCGETGERISQLVSDMESYRMCKEKFTAEKSQAAEIIESVKKLFPAARLNTIDGCRFDFDDGWLHLRTSNTEPVMRLISEFKKGSGSQNYIDAVRQICEKVIR